MSAATPEELFAFLDGLGIAHATVEHVPVHTVAESRDLKAGMPGGHSKNLFLKDKDGRLFLVVAEAEARIDLKRLHGPIGARAGCPSARRTCSLSGSACAPAR